MQNSIVHFVYYVQFWSFISVIQLPQTIKKNTLSLHWGHEAISIVINAIFIIWFLENMIPVYTILEIKLALSQFK